MIIIYGLIHPLTKEVRYVGQTNKTPKQRILSHIYESNRDKKRRVYKWIRSLIKEGLKPKIIVLEEDAEWNEAEKYWITQFDNLTNTTNGGDGTLGWNLSEEWRTRRSEAATKSNTGRRLSIESKKKMSESAKKRGCNSIKKLTNKQRKEIRQRYKQGNGLELATEYSVSPSLIYLIKGQD